MATITVPSDPTLPVAGAEIKAPPLKDWITNIRTFIESTSIDEGNVDTSSSDGIVGKSIAQTITGLKTFSSTAAAAGGLREVAKFEINPVSGTPAANDGLRMTFTADDAGGAATAIGYLDLKMTDASASSEDSEWRVSTIANAASVTPLVVNSTAITMTTGTVAVGTNATVGGTLVVTGGGTFGSLTVGSAAISEAELEMLDGITPGTIVADKAVVVNSNKDASDFRDVGARNIILTGELDAVTLDISGNADIDGTLEADAITLGGTALGSLYSPIAGGSSIVTTGALNSGSITSGFGTIDTGSSTITTTGVVTAGGLTIGSAVIIESELEMIDGITAGTAAASKAVVLDGSKNIATIGTIGSGAITSSGVVTATGFTIGSAVVDETELEILDGATVTTAELNLLDALDRGSIIYGNASGVTAVLGQGGPDTVLTSDGTDISWAASTAGDITSVVAGTGMTGGATSGAATLNVIGGNGITANAGDVAITAAQTTVTSVLNAALALGRDADNQIKFGTDDQIIFEVAGGDGVTFKASGEIEATSLDISGSADIDGTLEADAITLGGTALGSLYSPIAGSSSIVTLGTVTTGTWQSSTEVIASAYLDADTAHLSATQSFTGAKTFGAASQFNSTVTVGANDDGYDVIFYGNTASANATWDTSADDLILSGVAGLVVPDGQLTLGSTAITSTAAEINLLDALDRGSIIYGNASSATTVLGQGGPGTVLTSDGTDISWAAATGGHTIQEEGSSLTQRTKLNFIGAGVTATDDSGNDATKITVSATGASMPFIKSDGTTSDPITLTSAAVGESLVSDTSPQLGGNLDVNGQSIVSDAGNENIPITPHGTGSVVISKADINGGAIDGTTIGAASASTIAGTTLSATGDISFDGGSFVFNDAGADKDFRIEGDTQANLFVADASTDRIGIGTAAPTDPLSVVFSDTSHTNGLVLYNTNTAGYSPAIRFESDYSGSRKIHGAIGSAADASGGGTSLYYSVDNSALTRGFFVDSVGDILVGSNYKGPSSGSTIRTARIAKTGANGNSANLELVGQESSGTASNMIGQVDFLGLASGSEGAAVNSRAIIRAETESEYRNSALTFYTQPTSGTVAESMRISSAGSLLVGKAVLSFATVGCELKGSGVSYFTADGNPAGFFRRLSSEGTLLSFYQAGNPVGSVAVTSSSTAYNATSDYRLKENVVDLTGATTRVAQLQPRRFNFIVDADKTVDGFVAHEVSDIVPEAITGTKDGMRDVENVVVDADGAILEEGKTEAEWIAGKEPTLVSEATEDEVAVYADPIYAADTVWHSTLTVPEYQGIDQAKLVPLLTAAIQELTARVAALESA